MATDFKQAMESAREWSQKPEYTCPGWDMPRQVHTDALDTALDAMAAAHAVVVAERDSYRDVAHKLARYVLPDSDTLTIRQLVDAADAVCEAAEEGDDVD